MKSKLLIVFIIGWCSSQPVHSQATVGLQIFSIKQAQDYAAQHNTATKNANLDIGIAKNRIRELTRLGFPQITGETKYQNFIDIPTNLIPETAFNPSGSPDIFYPVQFGTSNTAIASLTATQLIFDGSYIVGLQAARRYLELTGEIANKIELDIRDQVEATYYMVLIAQENRQILKSTVSNGEKTVREAKAMHKLGFLEDSELAQFKLALSKINNAELRAMSQVKASYNLLKFHMGFQMGDTLQLSESLESITELTVQNTETIPKLILDNHIDYKLHTIQEDLLHLNHRLTKSKKLPTIGAFMSHSQNSFSNDVAFNTWYPTTLWGFSMQVPLFSTFMQTAREKQTFLDWQKAKNNKWQTSQKLKMQVDNAKTNYTIAASQKQTQEENMNLANSINDKMLTKHKEGLASSMEVTQAMNQLLEAQGQYIQSLFELVNSKSKLNKALNNYQ
jgi:outer membrane protein TolC